MLRATIVFSSLLVAATLSDNITPSQVHIALAGVDPSTGSPNGMAVSWQTEADTPTSVVKFGRSSGEYTATATGYSTSYYETFHHHVVLANLAPSTKYFYIAGDDSGSVWSKEFSFMSAPLSSLEEQTLQFAVFADLGVVNGDSSISFLRSIQNGTALIWHGGDISYADDAFLHRGCMFSFCYEETWDQFMNEMEPIVSSIPYMTAPGNHEV